MSHFIGVLASLILGFDFAQALGTPLEENTFIISEKLEEGSDVPGASAKFDFRARGMCSGDYQVVNKVIDKNKVKSTIRCLEYNKSPPIPASQRFDVQPPATPKETFAKLRAGIGMLPTCSGATIGKGHMYCGEKYTAAFEVGPEFNTRVMLNHYSLHKAASKPKLEESATKWRKEELHATSLMVSQGKNILGFTLGFGLGYFGATLNQREWIEYPFPQDDDTIAKERGIAHGLAMELYLERNFADTGVGDFNVGLSTSGLFPSTTSNPRDESKYWVLPTLEFSWKIDLKK